MRQLIGKIGRKLIGHCPVCTRNPYRQFSYSQDGEDRVLAKLLLNNEKKGFYVDVGAHHPKRFSNTYLFFEHGWKGINIDPIPGIAALFDSERSGDINIECGIGTEPGEMEFYIFDEPAFNTFNAAQKNSFEKRGYPKLVQTVKVPVRTLRDVLDKHLPPGQKIDFLSVDAESWDLYVLQSNDWSKYRPRVVVVECAGDIEKEMAGSPIGDLLGANGYKLRYLTVQTAYFIDTTQNSK